MRSLIVAGTDTGVGKTMLSSLLMASIPQARYWKPIQSGLEDETDTETVQRLSACDNTRIIPERYRLTQPLSPHLSARLDGVMISTTDLKLPGLENPLVVEAAGGVLVPIAPGVLQIELFRQWGLPVVIAARSSLGTINHTLLTLEALRARGIETLGVVPIGDHNPENERAISEYGATTIIGRIPWLSNPSNETLRETYSQEFKSLSTIWK